ARPAAALQHRALPEHAQYRRRRDGDGPEDERAQPLLPELGRGERVRDGGLRVPAERRQEPDRAGRGAGLLDRGRDQALPEEAGGPGVVIGASVPGLRSSHSASKTRVNALSACCNAPGTRGLQRSPRAIVIGYCLTDSSDVRFRMSRRSRTHPGRRQLCGKSHSSRNRAGILTKPRSRREPVSRRRNEWTREAPFSVGMKQARGPHIGESTMCYGVGCDYGAAQDFREARQDFREAREDTQDAREHFANAREDFQRANSLWSQLTGTSDYWRQQGQQELAEGRQDLAEARQHRQDGYQELSEGYSKLAVGDDFGCCGSRCGFGGGCGVAGHYGAFFGPVRRSAPLAVLPHP